MESVIRMLEVSGVVNEKVYDEAFKFSDDLYGVFKGGMIGIIDASGKLLIDICYDTIVAKYGLYFLATKKDCVHLYDLKGQKIVDKDFSSKTEALNYLWKREC